MASSSEIQNQIGRQTESVNRGEVVIDDEYEDCTFAVELHGLFDEAAVREAVEDGKCRVCKIDGDEPLLQIGSQLFVGKWEEVLGTDMIFREIPHRHLLNYVGCTEKRLVAQRVVLIPKNKDGSTTNDNVDKETVEERSTMDIADNAQK